MKNTEPLADPPVGKENLQVRKHSFTFKPAIRPSINRALRILAVDWPGVYVGVYRKKNRKKPESRFLAKHNAKKLISPQHRYRDTLANLITDIALEYDCPVACSQMFSAARERRPDMQISLSSVQTVMYDRIRFVKLPDEPQCYVPSGTFWSRNENDLELLAVEIKRAFRCRAKQIRTDLEENHEVATELIGAYQFCVKHLRRRGVEIN